MRLNQIRDFVAVIECGSINAAARKLGVSQPGITKSIKNLEAEMHTQLVQRTTRGVIPTAYGRAFFLRARVAQSELRKGEEEVQQLVGAGGGSVAFGAGPIASAFIVPEAVCAFRKQFPHAEMRLVEGFAHALVPLVRDETLDFAIGPRLPGMLLDAGISFRPLIHHHRVVAGRKGHPLAAARSLAKLVDLPWLSFEPRELLDQTFSTLGLPLPVR